MINNLYMFFDRVAQSYVGQIMIMAKDNVAMRTIKSFVKNPQFPYKGMEEDMQLYRIGTIDVLNGKIVSEISCICNLIDLVDKETKDEVSY